MPQSWKYWRILRTFSIHRRGYFSLRKRDSISSKLSMRFGIRAPDSYSVLLRTTDQWRSPLYGRCSKRSSTHRTKLSSKRCCWETWGLTRLNGQQLTRFAHYASLSTMGQPRYNLETASLAPIVSPFLRTCRSKWSKSLSEASQNTWKQSISTIVNRNWSLVSEVTQWRESGKHLCSMRISIL